MKAEVLQHHFSSRVNALAARREWLETKQAPCPECESLTTKLRAYSHAPAEWQCCECKTLFEYEP